MNQIFFAFFESLSYKYKICLCIFMKYFCLVSRGKLKDNVHHFNHYFVLSKGDSQTVKQTSGKGSKMLDV